MLYKIKLEDDNNMLKFKYELISVIIEINDRFNGNNRYPTYCKSQVDKKWYLYNFSKVENNNFFNFPFLINSFYFY